MNLQKVALSHLVASAQPRTLVTQEVDKLALSIKEVGLIQPITVKSSVVLHGIAEQGWQIVAGHHRVAACRALGWMEIDALVIDDTSHLQTELIEIDENLCRAELTAAQRTAFSKRRKQIWEALHPENNSGTTCPTIRETAGRPKAFAAATADATGQDKRTTNRAIARADAIGDEALAKVVNTSLDSGVELDALAKMDAPERTQLIERAAAGEKVSARHPDAPVKPSSAPARSLPIRLFAAAQHLVKSLGYSSVADLVADIKAIEPTLTPAEGDTLGSALDDLMKIGSMGAY